MTTLLADLVRRQTATALLSVFGRTIDKVAEEMAHDLLRDPDLREELRALVKTAFETALAELREPKPVEPDPMTATTYGVLREQLRALQLQVDELRRRASERLTE